MGMFEATEAYLQIIQMAQDPEVDPEVLADTLEAVEGEFEFAVQEKGKAYKQIESDIEGLENVIKRLEERKKHMKNSAERIKKSIEESMIATGNKKVKTELFYFNIQKNPAALVLSEDLDLGSVPAEYIIFPEPKIDNDAVKKALKDGETFEWATLRQTESLRIR